MWYIFCCICWQLFIHHVFGYRGVILFPWVGKVYDRDISTKEEKYSFATLFVMFMNIKQFGWPIALWGSKTDLHNFVYSVEYLYFRLANVEMKSRLGKYVNWKCINKNCGMQVVRGLIPRWWGFCTLCWLDAYFYLWQTDSLSHSFSFCFTYFSDLIFPLSRLY